MIEEWAPNQLEGPTLPRLQNKGQFSHEGIRHANWALPGSVKIQHTRCFGATACDNYKFMYHIRNILRILEVRKGRRGLTIN